jgi:hypothetical protein
MRLLGVVVGVMMDDNMKTGQAVESCELLECVGWIV